MALFALRYARALADVVSQNHLDPSDTSRQLKDFSASLTESRDLREVLLDPSISTERKVKILDAINSLMGCNRWVRNFLAVLIKNERLGALSEILDEYRLEMHRRNHIAEAEIISARTLKDQERTELERSVAQLAGSQVSATFREDKSLMGGAIVRIGSTVYDGSLRGRLERLKDRLVAG